ncbi:hypothetical protein THAOC_02879 [Thalassiosira oceanica]|uniref:RING-type domain-containing protein n=1 Tax=Thalassiosira oceanica TaxID=159749 RepID=K0TE18_THAOC|nr:hypothetical protein THAOC_02879 [Thalassiosira oceanica]|eukprot:EJK75399.1 hypothetical protein THAOC_02879 [Thalassiosira oceanica]
MDTEEKGRLGRGEQYPDPGEEAEDEPDSEALGHAKVVDYRPCVFWGSSELTGEQSKDRDEGPPRSVVSPGLDVAHAKIITQKKREYQAEREVGVAVQKLEHVRLPQLGGRVGQAVEAGDRPRREGAEGRSDFAQGGLDHRRAGEGRSEEEVARVVVLAARLVRGVGRHPSLIDSRPATSSATKPPPLLPGESLHWRTSSYHPEGKWNTEPWRSGVLTQDLCTQDPMWPFVNAAPQPSAAPRPLSRRSDRRAPRTRAAVSAQDVANDFVRNAGTATYAPDEDTRRAARPQHPRDGSTERSACSTRSFSARCGGTDATLPQLGATPTLSLARLVKKTLPAAAKLLRRLSNLYTTFTLNDEIDWNQKALADLEAEIVDTWRMVVREHESLAIHGHESRIDDLVTRVDDQLIQSYLDLSRMTETLQDKRLRITESLRPLNKTFNGLQLNSPEYKRLLNSMRAIKCDGINVDLRSGDVYRRSREVKILWAQLRQYEGYTRSMSHIPSWKEEITESRCLVQIRLDELASLQTAMARTEAELAVLEQTEDTSPPPAPRTTPRRSASQPQPAAPTAVRGSDKGQQSFQRGFDTTEGDVLGGTEEGVLGRTSSQTDDDSKSHSPTEVEGDKDINGTAFERVAPPSDGTTSHSHQEVEGDADIKGTAVDQAATTDGTVLTSYSMVEGDTKCGGADVIPQEDNVSDDNVQGLEWSASDLYDDTADRSDAANLADFPRSTASADADAEFTMSNVVPIGADAEVARQDDVLPPNITTSTDSPPSGGRESYEFILTKSGMDHKPVSLIQATADALPRQTTSPSCAPSLMAPADNITTPMTGGQGKGAPANAPPRQLTGQLSRRSTQNRITILQRASGPCEPTRAPHVTAPASESPKGGDKKKTKKKGGNKRSQIDERERGAPAPPPSHVPASHAPQVSDTTAGPRRLHPTSSTRRLWTAGSRRKSTPTVTVPRHELEQLRRTKRDLQMLTWRYARLRQDHHRLTQEIEQSTVAIPIRGEDDDDDDDDDDDEATVATSNLTGTDCCEDVPAQLDDGDDDDSVLTAPLLAFGLAPTGTEDIRLIETNNQRKSQDVEGLPLEPKRKRRRKRTRKRPRRRKGKANKRRPGHSPVTSPRHHDNARRHTAMTYKSFIKEINSKDAGIWPVSGLDTIWDRTACPASGFDTNWHRKGIGSVGLRWVLCKGPGEGQPASGEGPQGPEKGVAFWRLWVLSVVVVNVIVGPREGREPETRDRDEASRKRAGSGKAGTPGKPEPSERRRQSQAASASALAAAPIDRPRTQDVNIAMSHDATSGSDDVRPPAPDMTAAGPIPDAVTEEQLMSSGHELHESYTCPLFCIPMALPAQRHSQFESCCMKTVCHGCIHASHQRGIGNVCAFCRTPTPKSDAALLALVRKRVDAKDPLAIEFLAYAYYHRAYGLHQDIPRAFELWTEAARLGDLDAHFNLGCRYYDGEGVKQDVDRGIRHWQHAAIEGHPESRYMLGYHEYSSGNHELAVQHWMVSTKMGDDDSLNEIKDMFMKGHTTKAQYAEALEGYQNALEETKSPQREEAKAFFNESD